MSQCGHLGCQRVGYGCLGESPKVVMISLPIDEYQKLDRALDERDRYKTALEAIRLMVDAQAKDEALWSVPWEGLQPVSEAYLQQELRRLHECVEHYQKAALHPPSEGGGAK